MQQQSPPPQKKRFSWKGLRSFLHHTLQVISGNPQQPTSANQQVRDDLRNAGADDTQVNTFEDFLQDVIEAVQGWLLHSALDKKMATGLLAMNFLLLPVVLTWGRPDTSPKIIALSALSVAIPFLAFYILTIFTQEEQGRVTGGRGLLLMQLIFELGTAIAIAATLWSVFPTASIIFIASSVVAFLFWWVYMFRGALIAAHLRRFPPTQPTNQQSQTNPQQTTPPPQDKTI